MFQNTQILPDPSVVFCQRLQAFCARVPDMGIDEGILVVKQITDEHAWFCAMEDVRKAFYKEDYFRDHDQVTSDGERERAFEIEQLKLLEITEPLNFCDHGQSFTWWWTSFLDLVGDVDKDSLTDVLTMKEALISKKIKLTEDMAGNLDEYVHDRKRSEINQVETAINLCSEIGAEELQMIKNAGRYGISPPRLFEFCVGEHPSLPVFGRHFKMCESKVSKCQEASGVMKTIFAILKRHFPGHLVYWSEFLDGRPDYLIPKDHIAYLHPWKFFKSSSSAEARKDFYRKVEEHFKTATTTEFIHFARMSFATQASLSSWLNPM